MQKRNEPRGLAGSDTEEDEQRPFYFPRRPSFSALRSALFVQPPALLPPIMKRSPGSHSASRHRWADIN